MKKSDPDLKGIRGFKIPLSEGRQVSVQLLANGQYAMWFTKNRKLTLGGRLSEEAALALLAILDKLLREKIHTVVCRWKRNDWSLGG